MTKEKKPGEKPEINIEVIQGQLEECKKQKEEYLNGWKRERADFLNYKKEEIERIEGVIKYANEELILRFLPILDNVYLAEKQLSEDLKDHKWVAGIMNIKTQIMEFLKSQGVEQIKTEGVKFDPNFQEAVEEVSVEGKESGIVAEEVQKGYLLNGRVIRPAKVKISK
jgi:molecular chaperone GrpE